MKYSKTSMNAEIEEEFIRIVFIELINFILKELLQQGIT